MATQSLPDAADVELARAALRKLGDALDRDVPVTLSLADGQNIPMPRTATAALARILEATAHGDGTAVLPLHAELTTGQAADLLGRSRPHLVSLLEVGKIDYRMVGTHRRIKASSLIAFMDQDYSDRRAALDELTQETHELELT
jgi:excisionase family DNA binding protein